MWSASSPHCTVVTKPFTLSPQTLLQSFYGVRIVLTGDNLISENALVVLNHPTRCCVITNLDVE